MIVVIRPFKSGGKFYPAGEIIDPAGFKLLRSRIGEGKLAVVDEHNFEQTARYLQIRHGIENAEDLLRGETQDKPVDKPVVDEEYLAKVKALALQFDVDMEDRELEDVVAEIKQKAAEAKKSDTE
jgi:hypothetical protein